MKICLTVVIVALFLFFDSRDVNAEGKSTTALDIFEELKTLAGTWRVKDSERDLRIVYETTADGTVLAETWIIRQQKHSMTMYHLDKDRLIATHYCPQGNQPRLYMKASNNPKIAVFSFLDATNLKSVNDSHQHSLSFDLSSQNGLVTRSETYLKDRVEESSSLLLQRDH